jgi:hypothetical protein
MHLSAKKQRDLTFLEVQAQQIVNEEVDEDNDYMGGQAIKYPQKYEALLEKKKERRTVTYNITRSYFFRESHYLNSWRGRSRGR